MTLLFVCWYKNLIIETFILPQARWSDHLRKTTGRSWMRDAEDLTKWRAIGDVYVQQWIAMD